MVGTIIITCRSPGFFRAGMTHPARAEYPADRFTDEQMARLKAEPLLSVVEVPAQVTETPTDAASGETGNGDAAGAADNAGAGEIGPAQTGKPVKGKR